MDCRNNELFKLQWGGFLNFACTDTTNGIWMIFRKPLVLPQWQAPAKWRELIDAAQKQGTDFYGLFENVSHKIRDGKEHFALLGFPIPSKIGSEPTKLHWQALLLPILSNRTLTARGFRTNEKGYRMRDRHQMLNGSKPLDWQQSQNWHAEELACRGRYSDTLISSRFVLIGAGAIGSMFSELLIRGGVQKLTIIDNDLLEAGNLVRHTLNLEDVGSSKAAGLKKHLSSVSPHVTIEDITCPLESLNDEKQLILKEADIILDFTANDSVIGYLSDFIYDDEKTFGSIFVGYEARRLYIFLARCIAFPYEIFYKLIKEWVEKERLLMKGVEIPRTGTGCWHPAFPSRIDDMWLSVSTALKYFEDNIEIESGSARFAVFEQIEKDGKFYGIRLIREDRSHSEL